MTDTQGTLVTVEDLLEYVGSTDADFAQDCLDAALPLVSAYVGTAEVPNQIFDRAVLETASELFHHKNAPSGIQQFNTYEGAPVRLNRDPMTTSYSLLNKWIVGM